MTPTGSEVRRACNFCRTRKMRCSGGRPWCTQCKDRNQPCIYDTGAFKDKPNPPNNHSSESRPASGTLLFSGEPDQTLIQELRYFYTRSWDEERGWWAHSAVQPFPQMSTIDMSAACSEPQLASSELTSVCSRSRSQNEDGLSHILSTIVESLAAKCLPSFRQPDPFGTISSVGQRADQEQTDDFDHVNQIPPTVSRVPRSPRVAQLLEMAFCHHTFLPLIVSRTHFFKDFDAGTCDKGLLSSVLLGALTLKGQFADTKPHAVAVYYELPAMEDLAGRVTQALYGTVLGSLNSSKLQACAQSIMLLAWHELTLGMMRRASVWWVLACDLTFRIRSLRHLEDRTGVIVNGIDVLELQDEELKNMQTICQLMLLWLELKLGPISVAHGLLSCHNLSAGTLDRTPLILQLDTVSGNVLAAARYKTLYPTLCCIRTVLEGFVERLAFLKVEQNELVVPVDTNTFLAADGYASWYVEKARIKVEATVASYDTDSLEDGSIAVPLISFTALVACFQAARYARCSMNANVALHVIKVAAAITRQLREYISGASTITAALDIHGNASRASLIGLTIIESVARTSCFLLEQAQVINSPSERPAAPLTDCGTINLISEARNLVMAKAGVILGITRTMLACLDGISAAGKRIIEVDYLLDSIVHELEKRNVHGDLAFLVEVPKVRSSPQTPAYGSNANLKEEPMLDEDFNAASSSSSSSHLRNTAPATQGFVQQPETTRNSTMTMEPNRRVFDPALFQPQVGLQCSMAEPTGHIVHGPGPLAAITQDRPCRCIQYSPSNQGQPPSSELGLFQQGNYTAFPWSHHLGCLPPAPGPIATSSTLSNIRSTQPGAAFGEGLLETNATNRGTRSRTRAAQALASIRTPLTVGDESCESEGSCLQPYQYQATQRLTDAPLANLRPNNVSALATYGAQWSYGHWQWLNYQQEPSLNPVPADWQQATSSRTEIGAVVSEPLQKRVRMEYQAAHHTHETQRMGFEERSLASRAGLAGNGYGFNDQHFASVGSGCRATNESQGVSRRRSDSPTSAAEALTSFRRDAGLTVPAGGVSSLGSGWPGKVRGGEDSSLSSLTEEDAEI